MVRRERWVRRAQKRLAVWPALVTVEPYREYRRRVRSLRTLGLSVLEAVSGSCPVGDSSWYQPFQKGDDVEELADWLYERCRAALWATGSDTEVRRDGPFERL